MSNLTSLVHKLKNLRQQDLDKIIQQAKQLGISEADIEEGLKFLRLLKLKG